MLLNLDPRPTQPGGANLHLDRLCPLWPGFWWRSSGFTTDALYIDLHLLTALILLPVAAIGHVASLKTHDAIMKNDQAFKRWIGGGLIRVNLLRLWKLTMA